MEGEEDGLSESTVGLLESEGDPDGAEEGCTEGVADGCVLGASDP